MSQLLSSIPIDSFAVLESMSSLFFNYYYYFDRVIGFAKMTGDLILRNPCSSRDPSSVVSSSVY